MLERNFNHDRHHRMVRELIDLGRPGYAQSEVDGVLVSYAASDKQALRCEMAPPGAPAARLDDYLLDRIIVGLANGSEAAAAASARVFGRDRVAALASRLSTEGLSNHARGDEALDIRCFFLDPSAVGAIHLRD